MQPAHKLPQGVIVLAHVVGVPATVLFLQISVRADLLP
jgi:hypothetical protein